MEMWCRFLVFEHIFIVQHTYLYISCQTKQMFPYTMIIQSVVFDCFCFPLNFTHSFTANGFHDYHGIHNKANTKIETKTENKTPLR